MSRLMNEVQHHSVTLLAYFLTFAIGKLFCFRPQREKEKFIQRLNALSRWIGVVFSHIFSQTL